MCVWPWPYDAMTDNDMTMISAECVCILSASKAREIRASIDSPTATAEYWLNTLLKFYLRQLRHFPYSLALLPRPRVVHGSILCDPIQPNPSADWPNPAHYKWKIWTQPNTPNNGAYSFVVAYFYTRNLSRTFCHYHFITPSDRFLVPVRSAVKSNLTAWCNQMLSYRALNVLT